MAQRAVPFSVIKYRGVHTVRLSTQSYDNKWDDEDIDKVVCEVHGNKCATAGRENTFRLLD